MFWRGQHSVERGSLCEGHPLISNEKESVSAHTQSRDAIELFFFYLFTSAPTLLKKVPIFAKWTPKGGPYCTAPCNTAMLQLLLSGWKLVCLSCIVFFSIPPILFFPISFAMAHVFHWDHARAHAKLGRECAICGIMWHNVAYPAVLAFQGHIFC